MGNSYVRQSAADIQTGNIVEADPINAEFNALQSAFDASAGHSHDGTVGEGQKISLTSSIVGVLPVANGGYGGIHNNSASIDPGVTNDSSQGYSVGSVWINTTAKSYFVCTDNTLGAAVWNSFQLVDSALGSIAGLTTTANQTIYTTGSNTYATTSLTAYGRSLIDDADAATARTTLGLGSISTQASNAVSITGGTITGTPISGSTIAGTTGTFSGTITTGGNAVWHAGNLTPANYAPLAGATFTGGISGTTLNLSGTLTGVAGTFSGAVSGTTGTFSGTITSGGNAVWHAGNLTPGNYLLLAGGTMTGSLVLNADPSIALGAATKQYVDSNLGSAVPSSTVAWFARNSAPTGWLKANGAAISRTTYATLFAAIGTTFGVGDGSTTFNVPDLRGEFIRGWDDARGVDTGRAFGSAQSSQNLSHSHTASTDGSHSHTGATDSQGAHTHTFPGHNSIGGSSASFSPGSFVTNSATPLTTAITTNSSGAHAHNLSINAGGSHTHTINADGGTEARPRNIALLACIKF